MGLLVTFQNIAHCSRWIDTRLVFLCTISARQQRSNWSCVWLTCSRIHVGSFALHAISMQFEVLPTDLIALKHTYNSSAFSVEFFWSPSASINSFTFLFSRQDNGLGLGRHLKRPAESWFRCLHIPAHQPQYHITWQLEYCDQELWPTLNLLVLSKWWCSLAGFSGQLNDRKSLYMLKRPQLVIDLPSNHSRKSW